MFLDHPEPHIFERLPGRLTDLLLLSGDSSAFFMLTSNECRRSLNSNCLTNNKTIKEKKTDTICSFII